MTTKEAYHKIAESIFHIYGPGESVSISAIVMEDAFGVKRFQLNEEKHLGEAETIKLKTIISRLLAHEPVQYILGETQFFGLRFLVDPSVLIPRQETEELVAWVIEKMDGRHRVLDIGTGSGCIPVALKKRLPKLEMHALDVSREALETAKKNAQLNATEIHFHLIDILDENNWDKLPEFDTIISNPPYITEKEKYLLPPHVLDHEPHLALFSTDGDAQQFIKKITAFAKYKLRDGGYLFFETNEFYAPESKRILEQAGFSKTELRKDLNGKDRMLFSVRQSVS